VPDAAILHVAVPSPALESFDYLPPPGYQGTLPSPGVRVRVGFGGRRLVGLLVGYGHESRITRARLRPVLKFIDAEPIFSDKDLELLRWASRYYHYPLGEVIAAALPKRLRQGHPATLEGETIWHAASDQQAEALTRAPRQAAILALLSAHSEGLNTAQLEALYPGCKRALAALKTKRLVIERTRPYGEAPDSAPAPALDLNAEQTAATATMLAALDHFTPFVLDGVTGSGKTEVYLRLIKAVIEAGRQALVLVPEIALTPQLVTRFRARLSVPLAVIHSARSDVERHRAWHMSATGQAPVVIGTRSAVFVPLAAPGIIIVDEEHDASFKQQEGFRYHARDLAVTRASLLNVPVVLGSATPSLETLANVERGRYRRLCLHTRATQASAPSLELVDVRRRSLEDGLSPYVLDEIRRAIGAGEQVLVFLNRRGYAPALLCHDCGWAAACHRCDAKLTLHAADDRLRCHHCGSERSLCTACPACGSSALLRLGEGTERIEQTLKAAFPQVSLVRVDRDTTRRRGALQDKLAGIERGEHQLLVGTQMLSKGHDFPDVTLAVILNIDQNLYSSDFRALERAAQLIVQVAGRAGRRERPGKVILQTHLPEHSLLKQLLAGGYEAFSRAALAERRAAALPPYRHMALIRAEALRQDAPTNFLRHAQRVVAATDAQHVRLLGPAPAPMERRAGRYRAQLMLIATHRSRLQQVLQSCVPRLSKLPDARQVRFAIDVDPVDMS
jgi:primosomal protein N' (replication factor Y) (superfamily II helicase)